ncbi:unnamed protein product [Schistosoma curassoni]|uniref:Transporter n=1 Tax=Schistosoma curassoni TaxID=6186 RepID=A0A183JDA0_9TREM|nr:unnamed protein product [Schistosoma curassoni]
MIVGSKTRRPSVGIVNISIRTGNVLVVLRLGKLSPLVIDE